MKEGLNFVPCGLAVHTQPCVQGCPQKHFHYDVVDHWIMVRHQHTQYFLLYSKESTEALSSKQPRVL